MPNTTNPIPVAITVKIRYPGLKQIINQFKVYYEEYVHEGYVMRLESEGYLNLSLVPHSDEAIATMSLSGDRRYDVVVHIIFNGADIEDAIVRNYQLKAGS